MALKYDDALDDNVKKCWQDVLNGNREEICRRASPHPIIRSLRSHDVITESDKQEVEAKPIQRRQVDALVDVLLQKTEKTFLIFLTILRSREVGLGDLADSLEKQFNDKIVDQECC